MNLPADIPSYLSSQGTLSEPQEGYSNSEAGSHQQLMPSLTNGYAHKGTDGGISGSLPLITFIYLLCTDTLADVTVLMYALQGIALTQHSQKPLYFIKYKLLITLQGN